MWGERELNMATGEGTDRMAQKVSSVYDYETFYGYVKELTNIEAVTNDIEGKLVVRLLF